MYALAMVEAAARVPYLYGGLVGDVERQHGEAPRRVLLLELLELGGGSRRAARGDDAALVAPPQQLPHLPPDRHGSG